MIEVVPGVDQHHRAEPGKPNTGKRSQPSLRSPHKENDDEQQTLHSTLPERGAGSPIVTEPQDQKTDDSDHSGTDQTDRQAGGRETGARHQNPTDDPYRAREQTGGTTQERDGNLMESILPREGDHAA